MGTGSKDWDEINKGIAKLGLSVVAGGGVKKDVVALGEAGVEAIHASCRQKTC